MKKKMFSMLTGILLSVSLVACGNATGDTNNQTSEGAVVQTESAGELSDGTVQTTKGLIHGNEKDGIYSYLLWSSIFVTLLTVKIMFFTSVRIVLQKVFYNYYTNAVSHDCM